MEKRHKHTHAQLLNLHPHTCYVDSNYKPIGPTSCWGSEVNLPGFHLTALPRSGRAEGREGGREQRVNRDRARKEKARSNGPTEIAVEGIEIEWQRGSYRQARKKWREGKRKKRDSEQQRYRSRGHRLSTNHDGPNGQKSPHCPFNLLHRYDVTIRSCKEPSLRV